MFFSSILINQNGIKTILLYIKKTHNLKALQLIQEKKIHQKISVFKFMTQSSPVVQNVVSFAKMDLEGGTLDLKLIAQKIQNSRYNKKRFPAVILRKIKPKSTILVFKSGKMIIIGSESEKDAYTVAKKIVKDIQKSLGIKAKLQGFRVTNIVANAQIGWPIDIAKIADLQKGTKDDSFPGVVYRGIDSVKAALLFSSGKVVFTGATKRQAIDQAFIQLKGRLQKFRKIVDNP